MYGHETPIMCGSAFSQISSKVTATIVLLKKTATLARYVLQWMTTYIIHLVL